MILAAAALLALQTSPYSIQLVASPGSPYFPRGISLNDNSQVLYMRESARLGDLPATSYLWGHGTTTELVAPNPDPDLSHCPIPMALSDDGVVVGLIDHASPSHLGDHSSTFQWSTAQGWQDVTANGQTFMPCDINDHNDIVGIASTAESATLGILTSTHGFVPIRSLQMVESLDGSLIVSDQYQATLNDKGEVAFAQIGGESGGHVWSYRVLPNSQEADPLQLPPHLPYPDPEKNPSCQVMAVNNAGWLVGSVNMYPGRQSSASLGQPARSPTDTVGAVWSPDNTFYSIGAGYQATDINDAAQIVGCQLGKVHFWIQPVRAITYDTAHGVRYLDSLIPPGSPALENAISINSKGEILCSGVDTALYLLKPNGSH